MMRLADMLGRRVSRRLGQIKRLVRGGGATPWGPYRGNVDGLVNGELFGWVVRQPGNLGGTSVGLYVAKGLLATTTAIQPRGDVAAAGIGSGNCGFVFRLPPHLLRTIDRAGGKAHIRVLETETEIGTWQVSDGSGQTTDDGADDGESPINFDHPLPAQMAACRMSLYGDLTHLLALLKAAETLPANPAPPPLDRHRLMLSHATPARDTQTDMADPSALPAYLDYTRFRTRNDRRFDPDAVTNDRDDFLMWYIETYSIVRNGRRVPLSADLIAYLNTPMPMGGQQNTLTRAMWWRLLSNSPYRANPDPNNRDWYGGFVFWWAFHDVHTLHMEDCLVPRHLQDVMRAVSVARLGQDYPRSAFMERFLAEQPEFGFLRPDTAENRRLATLCFLTMAARRPYILPYLPAASVTALLDDRDGPSQFEVFCNTLTGAAPGTGPTPDRYIAALRLQGYDFHGQRYLTITDAGDRIEAAALPRPTGDPVDVQMIGPFKKASGLGQATRLSASVLAATPFSVNHVDFGLDNPAPEGFSKVGALTDYRPAKINLIHLNAESIPLVFAYGPDVFSGAYNIGYFFWELDTPAACHYLGMELLDEIWVSSQYGVDIYQPQTDKPVINVGMCFEELEAIDRDRARAELDRRFRFRGGEFVCLVAFDSYSFVQRKNPVGVVKAFTQAFAGVPQARLIIKTQNRHNVSDPVQDKVWKQVQSIMDADPRIHLLNETLSYDALLRLKAASDCYISLHKSEGWGFGMIEAMNLQVPVVCTGYSGNMEFCNADTAWLVGYDIVALQPDDYIFVRKGQRWGEPDIADAARQLRRVYDDPEGRAVRVAAAYANVQNNFSAQAIAQRYTARLNAIVKDKM